MKNRTPFCIYCNERMESQTSKKKFCSDKCRVYFHRKYPNGNVISPVELASKLEDINKNVSIALNRQSAENEPKEGSLAWFIKNS
jgi:tRNA(Ile2) C34 agmatinyltransferase TiaS